MSLQDKSPETGNHDLENTSMSQDDPDDSEDAHTIPLSPVAESLGGNPEQQDYSSSMENISGEQLSTSKNAESLESEELLSTCSSESQKLDDNDSDEELDEENSDTLLASSTKASAELDEDSDTVLDDFDSLTHAKMQSSVIEQETGENQALCEDTTPSTSKSSSQELNDCLSTDKIFSCSAVDCSHVTTTLAELVLHVATHYKFEVTSDSKSGETKFSYINGKYLCSLCPLETLSRTVFCEHVRHHLLSHPYKCGHCGDGMESLTGFHQHNRDVHAQLSEKLVICESDRIDSVMKRLGPQAPSMKSELATGIGDHCHNSILSADEGGPILIDDDGEDSLSISDSPNKTNEPERKEPLNQNFKYSLTKDGRLLCAQCKYMTLDVSSFGSHVFNDIHHALKNPCSKCNQRGKQSVVTQQCVIVDQIMRALVRQKELQNLPKSSHGTAQKGSGTEGLEAVSNSSLKAIGDGSGIESGLDRKSVSDGVGAQTVKAESTALSGSSFEETMALLRTLSSESICSDQPQASNLISNHSCDNSPEKSSTKELLERADDSAKKESTLRTLQSDIDESDTGGGRIKSLKVEKVSNGSELKAEKSEMTCQPSGLEELKTVKSECQKFDEKCLATTSIQKDDVCCRIMVYKSKPRKKMTLEELDEELRERIKSETSPEASSSTSYRCGIPGCLFTCSLDLNFKLHCMVKHPGMAALTCSLCQKGFENEDLLLDHINCEHNQGLGSPVEKGIYLCMVKDCGVSFNRVVELKAHFLTSHPHVGSFPCAFCAESVSTVDGIMTHIQTHLVNVMKCSYCRKVFNEKDELLAHISSSHEGLPKKINICVKIVNNTLSRQPLPDAGQHREESVSAMEKADSTGGKSPRVQQALTESSSVDGDRRKDGKDSVMQVDNDDSDVGDDDVEILAAKEELRVRCERCTYTCNTELQMKLHVYECHTMEPVKGQSFVCKLCNLATNVKETLSKHLAHHVGKNTVRYYVCPYCSKQSNQMDVIEDHVTNDHANEPFKFEVLQDTILYLQDMVSCPVCKDGFVWKEDFLHHLGSVHRLEALMSYMDTTFPEKPRLDSYKVPRRFLESLIPAPVKNKNRDLGRPSNQEKEVIVKLDNSDTECEMDPRDGASEFGKDGMILRFHCEICEFSSNDYPNYKEHMAGHGSVIGNTDQLSQPSAHTSNDVIYTGSETLYAVTQPVVKRMKFSCTLCPFECNKTLNYRRHMAIHERNKSMTDGFKCGYCQFLHDRQNCIKFHLGKYHGHLPPKICRIIAGEMIDVGSDDELMRTPRSYSLPANTSAEVSRERRAPKQVSRWSASWESTYSFTGRSRKFLRENRQFPARPMENIASDYMESDLPAGMIYPEPVKCPKCQFSNRVRINLVRHMKLHQNDGDIGMVEEQDEAKAASASGSADESVHRERTSAKKRLSTDCVKIEPEGNQFNFPVDLPHRGRLASESTSESARCPPSRGELSNPENCVGFTDSDLDPDSRGGGSLDIDLGSCGGNSRKLFKCCYCSIVSKWNRRDISLHILHVHMQKRVYSCQYCSYGSSKSSAIVMNHCSKIHPLRKVAVRDELALFNAIMPIQETSGIIPVAFLKPDGNPVLDLTELRLYVGLTGAEPPSNESRPATSSVVSPVSSGKRPRLPELDRDQPLDLSVKIRHCGESRSGAAQKVAPESAVESDPVGDSEVEFVEWKCKLCKFRNRSANHVKRHILCHHMRLKPFSCPYCFLYQWKAQAVVTHIDRFHPGQPQVPVSTVSEKSAYLSRNMTRVFVRPGTPLDADICQRTFVAAKTSQSQFTSFYRCRLCGFQEVRHDKTKYHVIKQHLKLGLFSCPYCHKYMWGRNYVARHVRSLHPGQEVRVQRTFDEYSNYLKDNIKKIGGSTVESTRNRSSSSQQESTISRENAVQRIPLSGTGNATSKGSPAHERKQRSYSCCYCTFHHSLAAKIQSHCLLRHPTRPVRYRENESGATDTAKPQIKVELTDDEDNAMSETLPPSASGVCRASPSPSTRPRVPIEMYMCRYCHQLRWSMEEMMAHLCESHPNEPPEFELMQEPSASLPPMSDREQAAGEQTNFAREKRNSFTAGSKNIDGHQGFEENDDVRSGVTKTQASRKSGGSQPDPNLIFKCRLCNYFTDKVTVMRHHVMSHLLYHPYRCPYCEHSHSVKSSPITKHIRLRHPGLEPRVSCVRDEEMEKQVRATYYRTVRDGTESTVPVRTFRKSFMIPLTPKMQKLSRRAYYKCKFCGLITHIRTDMKHHLMREIHYKPFICGYCNYTEPSRSGMGKHFRSKHCGMVIDIRSVHDPEEEARVEKMLEECVTRHNPDEPPNNSSILSELSQRNEPFKLLARKADSAQLHGPVSNSFARNLYSGFAVGPGRTQKSFSKVPKIHHCTQCSYTSISLRPLQAHMVKHRPARLQCGYCSHRSHYPSWIRKHIRSSHPGFAFKYCRASSSGTKPATAEVKREVSTDAPLVASSSIPSLPSPPPVSSHVAQQKKPQKQSQGPALLDGVELNIALVPGKDGYYRCPQCDYQTTNRSHYKMHSVIHRPRKWRCFYCSHKFPLIFRLRRHSSLRHPQLPVKWVDVATEQVFDDSTRMQISRAGQSNDTGKKSAQSQIGLKNAPISSFKPKTKNCSSRSSTDVTISVDRDSYNSQNSTDVDSDMDQMSSDVWFCCPSCPKKYALLQMFVDHLKAAHTSSTASFPTLEILPPMGEGELTLQRCGFCPYESFFKEDFDGHVRGHTALLPRKCDHCQFASFSMTDLEVHSQETHPHLAASFSDLDQPYTMTSDAPSIPDKQHLYNFDPTVKLVDVCKILQDKWDVI